MQEDLGLIPSTVDTEHRGTVRLAEYLPRMLEALSFVPSTNHRDRNYTCNLVPQEDEGGSGV